MADEEQQSHWDLKYERGLPSLMQPDPFFLDAFRQFVEVPCPAGGAALDLAGGLGRHTLWLAERRWQVTVVDISEVAVRKLRQKALELDLMLDLYVLDAVEYEFQPARFDLTLLFYHLNRDLCPRILSSLKPDGTLICKSSLDWSSARANLLQRNELPSLFPELQVLYHEERPVRDRGVVEFVGRRQME